MTGGEDSVPRVTAIVVGTNERPWLDACLSSLLASRGEPVRTVYVDNASSDGSAAYVRERFPPVEVVEAGANLGFSGANNLGLAQAREHGAAYAFLVNPDTRTPKDLVARLAALMDAYPEYGVVGPLQTEYAEVDDPEAETPLGEWSRTALANGEANVFADDAPRHPSTAGPLEGRAPSTLEHAYVQGAALFVRLEALARTGPFDATYHTFYEELDLARRMRWCGYRVALALDATIQHRGGGSTGGSPYRAYHMLRNRYFFLFTDPTWEPLETAALALRWLGQSLRLAFFGREDDWIRPTPRILASVLVWLVRNAPLIRARRREHARLARGLDAPRDRRGLRARWSSP
jgi:GT2 family glycosyltransferase